MTWGAAGALVSLTCAVLSVIFAAISVYHAVIAWRAMRRTERRNKDWGL